MRSMYPSRRPAERIPRKPTKAMSTDRAANPAMSLALMLKEEKFMEYLSRDDGILVAGSFDAGRHPQPEPEGVRIGVEQIGIEAQVELETAHGLAGMDVE